MWVCGTEPILRNEITDFARTNVRVSADVTGTNMRWVDHTYQSFLMPGSHLTVIHEAEAIQKWAALDGLLTLLRANEDRHVIFVSAEDSVHSEEKDDAGKKLYKPHIEMLRKSKIFGYVICNGLNVVPPTDRLGKATRASDAVLWLQTHGPLSAGSCEHVLRRCGADLAKARDVAQKVALFGADASKQALDLLCTQSVTDTFVESLLRGEKYKAVMAAREIPSDRLSQIIGQLDYLLDLMGKLHAYHRDFKSRRDASLDDTIPTHLALLYWEAAKLYDAGKRRHCRQSLAAIDSCLISSRGDGLLESLVALW